MIRCLFALAVLVGSIMPALGQTAALPKPAPDPSTQPFVPEGEKPFYFEPCNTIPGTRIWVQWLKGNIWHYNTSQSVGDGAAMIVYAPPGKKQDDVGWLCSMDTGVQPVKDKDGKVVEFPLTDYKGICLWIKGDGSDATAVFSTNWDFSKSKFRVPLKDTNWHKVFMAWDKWDEPITAAWYFLTYSIERKDHSKANWFIVDRVHFYKQEKVEEIKPTPDNDPPGMLPAKAFVSGADQIGKTLAKLRAKQPVKIVVAGDSIVWGAQLGYTKINYNYPDSDMRNLTYWKLLAARLKDHYGYASAVSLLRTYDDKTKQWRDELPKPSTTEPATPTPADTSLPQQRPAGDLQVIAVATGGWTAQHGLDHIEQILNEKPDLVIWEYGTNEGMFGRTEAYAKATTQVVDKLKAANIEVVLQTLPPSADPLPHEWLKVRSTMAAMSEVSDAIRKMAKDKGCALADMYSAMTARGTVYVGDLYADFVHLNHLGHEMCCDVLDALLTGRDVRVWTHGPAAEKAKADK